MYLPPATLRVLLGGGGTKEEPGAGIPSPAGGEPLPQI